MKICFRRANRSLCNFKGGGLSTHLHLCCVLFLVPRFELTSTLLLSLSAFVWHRIWRTQPVTMPTYSVQPNAIDRPKAVRGVYIYNLVDCLHICILKRDLARARRAWAILVSLVLNSRARKTRREASETHGREMRPTPSPMWALGFSRSRKHRSGAPTSIGANGGAGASTS